MQHCYLLCYDITSPKRLRKVALLMQAHGERVQKSVFECWLSPRQCRQLLSKTRELLDEKTDSVRLYSLCRRCSREGQVLGQGHLTNRPDSAVV